MLSIGGVDVPTPSELTVNIYDITEGDRDSTGTMHIDLVATKYKVEAKWSVLTQSQMSSILNAMSSITFGISFTDPTTGFSKSINVYKGDRSVPFMMVKDGITYYKDFKVNFIEL